MQSGGQVGFRTSISSCFFRSSSVNLALPLPLLVFGSESADLMPMCHATNWCLDFYVPKLSFLSLFDFPPDATPPTAPLFRIFVFVVSFFSTPLSML